MNLCDGHYVSGLVLIGSYTEQPTKNGSSYFGGTLNIVGSVPFKVWQGVCFDDMKSNDYSGKICQIDGSVNIYNGSRSLILQSIVEVPKSKAESLGISELDFFEAKYNVDKMYNDICTVLQKTVSENALKVFNIFMNEIREDFIKEFAAVSHHDNCFGGLVAHTAKALRASLLIKNYPNIFKRVTPDLVFLGIALHDIGKVKEYCNGVVSDVGKKVSHLTLGCIMLSEHKEEIVSLMGEDFYYSLMSVISQHHGEYGETPRTIAAYIINQFDCLDALLTSLDEVLGETEEGQQIKFDDMKLV